LGSKKASVGWLFQEGVADNASSGSRLKRWTGLPRPVGGTTSDCYFVLSDDFVLLSDFFFVSVFLLLLDLPDVFGLDLQCPATFTPSLRAYPSTQTQLSFFLQAPDDCPLQADAAPAGETANERARAKPIVPSDVVSVFPSMIAYLLASELLGLLKLPVQGPIAVLPALTALRSVEGVPLLRFASSQ
jgi:hypothetical protein